MMTHDSVAEGWRGADRQGRQGRHLFSFAAQRFQLILEGADGALQPLLHLHCLLLCLLCLALALLQGLLQGLL